MMFSHYAPQSHSIYGQRIFHVYSIRDACSMPDVFSIQDAYSMQDIYSIPECLGTAVCACLSCISMHTPMGMGMCTWCRHHMEIEPYWKA